jgi:L-threonylcarbamoyladenylate synthase
MHNNKSNHTEIEKALLALQNGKTILYPTDTVWGIGCDATNEKAVKKVYKLKHRIASKSLIVLVNGFEMLEKYVENVSLEIREYLSNKSEPITVIYSNPKCLAKNLIAADNTIAIRIVKDVFCTKLISKYNRPIVSTSANISGAPTPLHFSEIETKVIDNVGYVVNLELEFSKTTPSKIVKIINEEIIVLRG